MARNSLAGKSTGASKTAKHYAENAASKAKKKEYDSDYQKSTVAKRVEANKANRKEGTYGNGDGKDASHSKSGSITMEAQAKNRARNGATKGRPKSARRKNTKR
jgi:hypothetical protein